MILVFGSELDPAVRGAVEDWEDAALATPADLCAAGWYVRADDLADATLVANGIVVPASSLSGVVNLLPVIGAHELFDIRLEARNFVAAEANAFLLFLLTAMPCPVVNRPSSERLNGPNWRPEQWLRACCSAGIPTAPARRDSTLPVKLPDAQGPASSVTLLDGSVIVGPPSDHVDAVRRLAKLAGTTFIKVNFVDQGTVQTFHSVELAPDLSDPAVRKSLASHFSGADRA